MAGRPRRTCRRAADAFDLLRDAGGRLHTLAPDHHLDGNREDAMPHLWQNSLEALMAASGLFADYRAGLAGLRGRPPRLTLPRWLPSIVSTVRVASARLRF